MIIPVILFGACIELTDIFQSLPIVEVGQAVQSELLGVRQDGQSITFSRPRCRALQPLELSI